MSVIVTYRPAKYSKKEMIEFQKFRKKIGPDYRFCQNRSKFRTKNRTMRKILVGLAINDDIFLLYEVEYGWYTRPQTENGEIEITSVKLAEVNDTEPSDEETEKYSTCYLNNEIFNNNLVEADYYRYDGKKNQRIS